MPVVRFTPLARADLIEIRSHIAADSREYARQTIETIKNACFVLGTHPFMGRTRHELLENLRSFPIGSYVIFYDVVTEGIEIIRVLHGARDLPQAFSPNDGET